VLDALVAEARLRWGLDLAAGLQVVAAERLIATPLEPSRPALIVPLAVLYFSSWRFLFGWAKPVPVNVRNLRRGRRDYVLVAAAGPASNLLIAVFASLALGLVTVSPMRVGEPNVSAPVAALLAQAVPLNILLAVFNMIPIPPLDGGNVLGGLLPQPLGAKYDALMRPYGFILLYALILTRGFDYVVIPPARFLLSLLQ